MYIMDIVKVMYVYVHTSVYIYHIFLSIIHPLLPLIDFGKFHIFPQFSHLYRGTHRNVGYIQLEEILKEEERETQTERDHFF